MAYSAYDINKNDIKAIDVKHPDDRGYFCKNPRCGFRMSFRHAYKRGENIQVIACFAHLKGSKYNCDGVSDDEDRVRASNNKSEWHINWQNCFPEYTREIEKWSEDGVLCRADVLLEDKKLVLEFQHSRLDVKQFKKRNTVYNSLGYHVIWLYDLDEYHDKNILSFLQKEDISEARFELLSQKRQYAFNFDRYIELFGKYDPEIDVNVTLVACYKYRGKEVYYKLEWVRTKKETFDSFNAVRIPNFLEYVNLFQKKECVPLDEIEKNRKSKKQKEIDAERIRKEQEEAAKQRAIEKKRQEEEARRKKLQEEYEKEQARRLEESRKAQEERNKITAFNNITNRIKQKASDAINERLMGEKNIPYPVEEKFIASRWNYLSKVLNDSFSELEKRVWNSYSNGYFEEQFKNQINRIASERNAIKYKYEIQAVNSISSAEDRLLKLKELQNKNEYIDISETDRESLNSDIYSFIKKATDEVEEIRRQEKEKEIQLEYQIDINNPAILASQDKIKESKKKYGEIEGSSERFDRASYVYKEVESMCSKFAQYYLNKTRNLSGLTAEEALKAAYEDIDIPDFKRRILTKGTVYESDLSEELLLKFRDVFLGDVITKLSKSYQKNANEIKTLSKVNQSNVDEKTKKDKMHFCPRCFSTNVTEKFGPYGKYIRCNNCNKNSGIR